MRRKFISNLLFVLILNLLVKPFWILGIDVTVQNRVGSEYGFYYALFGFSILLNIILDVGITNYNSRTIARHEQMLGRYFSGIFSIKLILGVLYMLATVIFGWVVGYDDNAITMLFVLGINQFLNSMILYLRSNLNGLHLFKQDALFSIMDRVLMIIICSILLWSNIFQGEFKIEWFVYAQFWAYFITAFTAFIMVAKKAKLFRIKVDIPLFISILKESFPFALLVLLMAFYYRLDSVMIERMLIDGKRETGVYAQAYRILEAFNMLGYLFAGLLLPIFSRMIKNKMPVSKLVNTSFNLIFIPAIAIVTTSLLYSEQIMDLLYIENIEESASVFAVLMCSFVAIALTYIYGTLLTANGSLKQLNSISLLGLVLNFVMNYWLIPEYGAYGAAMATLATQALVVVLQIIFAKKLLKMNFSQAFIVKMSLLITLGLSIVISIQQFFDYYILHIVVIFIVFGALSIGLGLIKKEELLEVLKSKEAN